MTMAYVPTQQSYQQDDDTSDNDSIAEYGNTQSTSNDTAANVAEGIAIAGAVTALVAGAFTLYRMFIPARRGND